MFTEFTWIVPLEKLPADVPALLAPVPALADPAVCPEALALVEPALPDVPALPGVPAPAVPVVAFGVSCPVICTSCPTWLLNCSLAPVNAYDPPLGCASV